MPQPRAIFSYSRWGGRRRHRTAPALTREPLSGELSPYVPCGVMASPTMSWRVSTATQQFTPSINSARLCESCSTRKAVYIYHLLAFYGLCAAGELRRDCGMCHLRSIPCSGGFICMRSGAYSSRCNETAAERQRTPLVWQNKRHHTARMMG